MVSSLSNILESIEIKNEYLMEEDNADGIWYGIVIIY